MLPGGVKGGAPATDRWVGALPGVMAKLFFFFFYFFILFILHGSLRLKA